MSVTFYPEDIEYIDQEVRCFCGGDDEYCPDCGGSGWWSEQVPAEHFAECNFSNINTSNILRIAMPAKIYEDLCGQWNQDEITIATKNLIRVLNNEGSPLVEQSYQDGNFYHCGSNQEQAQRRVTALLEVLHCCKKHNCNLNFA